MVSRIDPSSVSVPPEVLLSMFSAPPTQEGIMGMEMYDEILSENATDTQRDGDVIVLRCNPPSNGEGYDLSQSWIKTEFSVIKNTKATMREDLVDKEEVAPMEGWPSIGLFSRESLTFNQTPTTLELASGSLDAAQFVDAMLTRPARDLAASAASEGWYRDELDDSPGAHMTFAVDTSTAAGSVQAPDVTAGAAVANDGFIQINIPNSALRAAKIRPSSNGVDASGVPQVIGDLRDGMRCRLTALAGTGANVADFNKKLGGVDMFIRDLSVVSTGGNKFAAKQFLQPDGDGDAGVTKVVFQLSGDGLGLLKNNNAVAVDQYPQFFTVAHAGNSGGTGALTRDINKLAITVFPDDRSYASMRQRRAQDLPLGMNKGRKASRAKWLAGGASGASDTSYPHFTVATQPMNYAWRNNPYLPPGVLAELKLTRNNFNRNLVDYSADGFASKNLTLKIHKVSAMLKRIKYSPQIDSALSIQYQQGSQLKIAGRMHRQFSQRIAEGVQSFVIRSFGQGALARLYAIYFQPDDVASTGTAALPLGGKSVLDLGFESGVYPTSLFMSINGLTYPHRRLETVDDSGVVDMNVNPPAGSTNVPTLNNKATYTRYSGDTSLPYWLFRQSLPDASDPSLTAKQWGDRPIFVIDTSLCESANQVDVVQENTVAELHVTLNKQTTQAMQVCILSYTETLLEIDGSGNVQALDA